jgi:hypothetical protein
LSGKGADNQEARTLTIASETNRSGPYNGNGVTTAFDYDFKISDETHIQVILADADGVETILELTADYTVSGVGVDAGGQVTISPAPASGETVTLLLDVPFTQGIDLENQGAYSAETVERGLDLALQRTLQLKELVDRSVKLAASDATGDLDQLLADIRYVAANADTLAALTPVEDQINLAADEAFADTAELIARKADGSLIKRSWANVKTALESVFLTITSAAATYLPLSAVATAAHYRANTADKVLDTDGVWAAAAEVTLTDAATITFDQSSGINFKVTLGGNRTMGQPSSTINGKTGRIIVKQDATGSRTLSWHADYEFPSGTAPTLSTTANAEDVFYYDQIAANRTLIMGPARAIS